MPSADAAIESVKTHLLSGRFEAAGRFVASCFDDPHINEGALACLVGMLYESEAQEHVSLLDDFLDRYPQSLHIIRVYHADFLARKGDFDKATEEARMYLRLLKEGRGFGRLTRQPILQEGAALAFFLLTASYTVAGARSYCRRVLRAALRQDLPSIWKDRLQDELFHQEEQLSQNGSRDLDRRWEAFFENGSHAAFLHQHAANLHLPALALRIEILSRQSPLPLEKEMHLLIQPAASGELILH